MTDYDNLVAALRYHADTTNCDACKLYDAGKCELKSCVLHDAADAIEALDAKADYWMGQAQEEYEKRLRQMPKRGEWELIDGVEPMRWGCSRCKYLSWETSNYCPRCGAKMTEVQE